MECGNPPHTCTAYLIVDPEGGAPNEYYGIGARVEYDVWNATIWLDRTWSQTRRVLAPGKYVLRGGYHYNPNTPDQPSFDLLLDMYGICEADLTVEPWTTDVYVAVLFGPAGESKNACMIEIHKAPQAPPS